MIDQTAATLAFRNRMLSLVVATTGSQTLAATATGYTRATGSFLADGFADGLEFVPAGFSDVTPKVIESVSALSITTTSPVTAQSAGAGRSLVAGVPATRGFDNKRVKPISGRPYIEEEFVPGGHSLMGTTSGMNNEDGTYRIRYYGIEGKGIAGIRKWIDALKALYAPGTNLVAGANTVRVRTDSSVRSTQIIPLQNGWAYSTLIVPWWALSNNTIAA